MRAAVSKHRSCCFNPGVTCGCLTSRRTGSSSVCARVGARSKKSGTTIRFMRSSPCRTRYSDLTLSGFLIFSILRHQACSRDRGSLGGPARWAPPTANSRRHLMWRSTASSKTCTTTWPTRSTCGVWMRTRTSNSWQAKITISTSAIRSAPSTVRPCGRHRHALRRQLYARRPHPIPDHA